MTKRNIKCRKCENAETIYVNEETINVGTYSRMNTFLCKGCEQLNTINTVNEKVVCKNCKSNDLVKFFSENKIKCAKCGNKAFDATTGVEF